MDPEDQILVTATQVVGCNGLRNFADLGKMRQQTLEKRLHAAKKKLTRANMMSIFAMWLRDQLTRIGGAERTRVVRDCCNFFQSWECDLERVLEVWEDCTECTVRGLSVADEERAFRQMNAVHQEIKEMFPPKRGNTTWTDSYRVEPKTKDQDPFQPLSKVVPPQFQEVSTNLSGFTNLETRPPPPSKLQQLGPHTGPVERLPLSNQVALRSKDGNVPLPPPINHPPGSRVQKPKPRASFPQLRKKYSGVVPSGVDLTTELWNKCSGTSVPLPLRSKNEKDTRSTSKDVLFQARNLVSTSKVTSPSSRLQPSDGFALGIESTTVNSFATNPKVDIEIGGDRDWENTPVPRNYICKRCGVKGHFIQDCPTNSDPDWDPLPSGNYVCKRCGVKGHYVQHCPTKLNPALTVPPRPEYVCKTCNGKDHHFQHCPLNLQDRQTIPDDVCRLCSVTSGRHIVGCPNAHEHEVGQRAGNQFHCDDTMKEELPKLHEEDFQNGRLSPWESGTHPSRHSEEIEQYDLQGESAAHHAADEFLGELQGLTDMRIESESAREYSPSLSDDTQSTFSWTPPRKRQRTDCKDQDMEDIQEVEKSESEDPLWAGTVPTSWGSDVLMRDLESSEGEVDEDWEPPSSSEASEPFEYFEPADSIERNISQKSLFQRQPYDETVFRLLWTKRNVWVNPPSRPTALDMWDI